jgi:phosphotransferase system HPr (HPr) family protein
MIRKDITLLCPEGLQARAASLLVQCANRYDARITLTVGQKTVNAKSLMGVLSLGLIAGQTITLFLTGTDEEAACTAISALFTGGFSRA